MAGLFINFGARIGLTLPRWDSSPSLRADSSPSPPVGGYGRSYGTSYG